MQFWHLRKTYFIVVQDPRKAAISSFDQKEIKYTLSQYSLSKKSYIYTGTLSYEWMLTSNRQTQEKRKRDLQTEKKVSAESPADQRK